MGATIRRCYLRPYSGYGSWGCECQILGKRKPKAVVKGLSSVFIADTLKAMVAPLIHQWDPL